VEAAKRKTPKKDKRSGLVGQAAALRVSITHWTPSRIEQIGAEVSQELVAGLPMDEAMDVLDHVDACIIGLEEICELHVKVIEEARSILETRVGPYLDRRKEEVKQWVLARDEEDIEEVIPLDRRLVEEEKFVSAYLRKHSKKWV